MVLIQVMRRMTPEKTLSATMNDMSQSLFLPLKRRSKKIRLNTG